MFGQVPLRLKAEVAILASERSHVGVGSDVFLQHGRFLTADTAGVTDIFAPTPTSDVGVVIIGRLKPSLHCPHWLAAVNILKLKQCEQYEPSNNLKPLLKIFYPPSCES